MRLTTVLCSVQPSMLQNNINIHRKVYIQGSFPYWDEFLKHDNYAYNYHNTKVNEPYLVELDRSKAHNRGINQKICTEWE